MLMLSWFCRSRNCWKEFQRINAVPRTEPKYMYYTQMLTLNKMIAVFLPTSISRTPHLKDIIDPIKSGLSPESCEHQLWLYFHFMLQSSYISKTLQLFNSTDMDHFRKKILSNRIGEDSFPLTETVTTEISII